MDKTGRNGFKSWRHFCKISKKYEKLKKKHIQILNFYDFEYNLDEMESNWFKLEDTLKISSYRIRTLYS